MPNWIEGNVKIRGKQKDIYEFLKNGFHDIYHWGLDENGNFVEKDKLEDGAKFHLYDLEAEIEPTDGAWIEGTRRAFATGGYVFLADISSEEERTVCFSLKQAWAWQPENWKALSDKYNLDFKLIGWEKGMEYKGECECLRGCDPVYTETKYDDWVWETECPYLGG